MQIGEITKRLRERGMNWVLKLSTATDRCASKSMAYLCFIGKPLPWLLYAAVEHAAWNSSLSSRRSYPCRSSSLRH